MLLLADVLASDDKLERLSLRNCDIRPSEVAEIASSLSRNTTLSFLDLRSNKCSDKGVMKLAAMLHGNSTLTALDLQKNKITKAGFSALRDALGQNQTLCQLNLQDNDDEPGLLQQILAHLQKNQHIAILNQMLALKEEETGHVSSRVSRWASPLPCVRWLPCENPWLTSLPLVAKATATSEEPSSSLEPPKKGEATLETSLCPAPWYISGCLGLLAGLVVGLLWRR